MVEEGFRGFGAVVNEVSKLYSEKFDKASRLRTGISLAQYRLLAALALHEGPKPMSQIELAERMDITPMGVVGLCQRMEQHGWIKRTPSLTDRRVNQVTMEPAADEAFDALFAVGNQQADEALCALSPDERSQLLDMLGRVHLSLRRMAMG